MGIAADIVLILAAGLVGGLVAHLLRQPLLVGYILAGVIVGPHTAGPTVVQIHDVELLAEIGVALLLFALGLELSFKDLRPVRRIALIGGPIQIVLTSAFGYALSRAALGWEHEPALWIGAMFSLSSTMIVIKILTDKGDLRRLGSRVMIGVLIVQDLALAPMLIMLPRLGNLRDTVPELSQALLQGALFLATMVLVGTKIVPALLRMVAGWNSRELFLVAVVVLGVGVGYGTYLFGLSFALGGFVAGIVLSESEYSHQALSDIIPLRDVFGLIFFASAGMLLDVGLVRDHIAQITALVLFLIPFKAALIASLVRLFGYREISPWTVGLGLAQVGEFSFVLAGAGLKGGSLNEEQYGVALSVTLATMVLAPGVERLAGAIHSVWSRTRQGSELVSFDPLPREPRSGHIVVAGLGRSGWAAVHCMQEVGLPFAVVELHHGKVEAARRDGLPIVWGDATKPEVLRAAGVDNARLLLVTLPDAIGTLLAVEQARKLNPSLHVVARVVAEDEVERLSKVGVHEAVQPQFEAGLELVRQVLVHFSIPDAEIRRFGEIVRGDFYQPLREGPRSSRYKNLLRHLRPVRDAGKHR